MYDPWFVWALVGVSCIGLEMLLPGFVIFFFGMGALATALCSLMPPVAGALWLQIILFVFFSILSLVLLRRRFTRIFEGTVFNPSRVSGEEEGTGEMAEVVELIGPAREGRIRFRGTTWKARCATGEFAPGEFAPGSMVKIVERDGMTYVVKGGNE